MLFDPKWERRAILRELIAWLDTKPAAEKYNWSNIHFCACAQFFDVGSQWTMLNGIIKNNTGLDLNELARGEKAPQDWTFGKLRQRAAAELERV
jgi:hypothetical protein